MMRTVEEVMRRKGRTTDAVGILHKRYVKGDPEREAALEKERLNADVAKMIYDLRTDAGLSQKELAELVGTTQSVISRLEDSDYGGHSLSMLRRIAGALGHRLAVAVTPKDEVRVVGHGRGVSVRCESLGRKHGRAANQSGRVKVASKAGKGLCTRRKKTTGRRGVKGTVTNLSGTKRRSVR
jgi:transcriptional regulator with XRE-family HTH domain